MKRFRIANYLDPNPPNGKRVTRPSRWGNPFRVGHEAALVELASRELRGFDLGCTCPLDQPCHADVWIELLSP